MSAVASEVERVRAIIIESCDRWLARGGRIEDGEFSSAPHCRCALGTVVDRPPRSSYSAAWYKRVCRVLRIDEADAENFVAGFDGDSPSSDMDSARDWYDLGAELRARYLGGGR